MEAHERLRHLRNELGMTLEKFGEKIGVGKGAISAIETGKNKLTNQMIHSICNINWNGKYVNSEWLRTGTGDMFLPTDRNIDIARLTKQLLSEESDSFKNRLVSMLANLSEEEWELLERKAKELVQDT